MTWEEVRERKLSEQQRLLAPYQIANLPLPEQVNDVTEYIDTLFTDEENRIASLTIEQLQKEYLAHSLTAHQVASLYCRRAAVGHGLANFITEVRFEEALKEAAEQDNFLEQKNELVGPFHGIVVSLKDNINVKGLATSMGFVGLAEEVAAEDSAIVKLLRRLGAIIICKTNTSSGMMYSETVNTLWGRTLNPHNRQFLNNGGSSGGEAAIGALRGSSFGIGSDIGGSVRHPAALNGIYSVKPSFGRIPTYGTASGQPGQESIKSIYGVMSYYLENVEYVLKTIIDSKPHLDIDAGCLPLEYRTVALPQRLKIAILDNDGTSTATAPLVNALSKVRSALEAAGHEVVEWPNHYLTEIKDAIYPFFGANGYRSILELIEKSGEPVDPLLSKWFPTARDMPVSELWELQRKRTALTQKYMELWNKHGLDAIITPASPFPACLKNGVVTLPFTAIWNGLDYSGTTLPVGKCNVTKDTPYPKTEFISEVDRHVHETYAANLAKFDGAAVSLQVICRRLEDEKVMEITKYLASLL
ncbi:hypothetical protein KL929_005243 [Ogataea haglerorum]|uniref:uncharacterized protein n=1 Tax=Ogataea haglerorum TaxID=1937702 RepID=UPI001C8945CE|nr:uncharacterized protein KL911_005257 [Ogataea haglerorum]KAG7691616.1 hypothetical protein KL915_005166 [Ogataea haglerorum]KAG7692014.1 hypothetical protein KL951_005218 [Ogataea haglerorum]KAG7744723.1 hypothetical protein KL912_005233 [Ogataea haglerorum]KAG7749172.1 hypothetical protein KL911_005257 [Ogataea haglerorum]KAG7794132.1 hypothetical protein KL929_005243 [Ogataea haglerorum]